MFYFFQIFVTKIINVILFLINPYLLLIILNNTSRSTKGGSEMYQYVVHNLTWSGVKLRSTFSNTLLQKVLAMLILTETGPKVYISTTENILFESNDDLEETLNSLNNLKLRRYME